MNNKDADQLAHPLSLISISVVCCLKSFKTQVVLCSRVVNGFVLSGLKFFINEPHHEKNQRSGFQPGPTQTRLYSYR